MVSAELCNCIHIKSVSGSLISRFGDSHQAARLLNLTRHILWKFWKLRDHLNTINKQVLGNCIFCLISHSYSKILVVSSLCSPNINWYVNVMTLDPKKNLLQFTMVFIYSCFAIIFKYRGTYSTKFEEMTQILYNHQQVIENNRKLAFLANSIQKS